MFDPKYRLYAKFVKIWLVVSTLQRGKYKQKTAF